MTRPRPVHDARRHGDPDSAEVIDLGHVSAGPEVNGSFV